MLTPGQRIVAKCLPTLKGRQRTRLINEINRIILRISSLAFDDGFHHHKNMVKAWNHDPTATDSFLTKHTLTSQKWRIP